MARIEGLGRLITNLTALRDVWDDDTIVKAGAGEFVKAQQENVRKKLNKNPRGVLENALQVIPIDSRAAEAGVPADTIIYAFAHEYGVVIVPRKAKALRFEIDGKVIFAQRVTIPARPYVRPSVKEGKRPAVKAIIKATKNKMRDLIK
jgi:hypothetical protein